MKFTKINDPSLIFIRSRVSATQGFDGFGTGGFYKSGKILDQACNIL
jgi:hypothetical protein